MRDVEFLIKQGEKIDSLFFLKKGQVKIIKDGYEISTTSDVDSVFGELSIMLGGEHSATVQCVGQAVFYRIDNPRKYLESHPEVIWHIVQVLSLRLFTLSQYLVDVKREGDGGESQKMVERKKMISEVLQILQVR